MGRTGAAAREHVTLMKPTTTITNSVRSTTYAEYSRMRAEVTTLSPGELIRAEKIVGSRRFNLLMRPVSSFDTTWRVVVRGTTCNVLSNEPIDGRKRWHNITCEEVSS